MENLPKLTRVLRIYSWAAKEMSEASITTTRKITVTRTPNYLSVVTRGISMTKLLSQKKQSKMMRPKHVRKMSTRGMYHVCSYILKKSGCHDPSDMPTIKKYNQV